MLRLCLILLAALTAALASGCGTGVPAVGEAVAEPEPVERRAAAPAATAPPPARVARERPPRPLRCVPGAARRVGSDRQAFAAVVERKATARRAPGGAVVGRFGPRNVNGVNTVLGVLGEVLDEQCRAAWYHVRLPLKPNGATGYVPAAEVTLRPVTTRILVDLSDRAVTLFRDGRVVMRVTAAIGARATPTPTGQFYVNQKLLALDAKGPYGPGAIGISAFSEVLTDWAQGGPVAIHGTNRPDLIGLAVSNGCLRIRNDQLLEMFRQVPTGTPVTIRA